MMRRMVFLVVPPAWAAPGAAGDGKVVGTWGAPGAPGAPGARPGAPGAPGAPPEGAPAVGVVTGAMAWLIACCKMAANSSDNTYLSGTMRNSLIAAETS